MDDRDHHKHPLPETEGNSSTDSSLHTDEESARLDFEALFSNRFSNISAIYSSSHGATEIHAATRYGKRFALKGLKKEHAGDPVHNMCMAKEFEIGITLDHTNIRRTMGLEDIPGLGKRIILEYIDGVSLSDVLAGGKMEPGKARRIAMQIVDAVEYLHSKQIFHRDLKPENIMLLHKGGIVKLIDFNLSDREDYVILKHPAGSKRYMAPEQSDPGAIPTAEADLYSLGVIMKELAEACGDRSLARAAAACMDRDPQKRRKGLDMLEVHDVATGGKSFWGARILDSEALTYILSGTCIVLATFITAHYLS